MNVLFICAQNVGRSQTAAVLLNKYHPSDHADSAGTNVEKPGETIAQRAEYSDGAKHVLTCLQEEGLDISHSVRTPVTPEMLDHYDRIINMAELEKTPDWLRDHPKYEYWEIEDPRYKSLEETKKMQAEIKRRVQELY
jgi:protein-tyrosine-phosphatase